MIISFGWTSEALLAGHKTVTRRDWNPKHAAKFKAGMLVDAWNTSPRNTRGNPHKIATIRLTADLVQQMSDEPRWDLGPHEPEFAAEGFGYLENTDFERVQEILDDWIVRHPRPLYVVRFEAVS